MSTPAVNPSYYADFGALARLKGAAQADAPAAIRAAARQFESLFTSMLLKTMREASLGEGLGDSDQTRLYQDMYDQQLGLALSQGHGLGLADLLVQQLMRSGPGQGAEQRQAAAAAPAPADFVRALTPWAEEAGRRLGVAPDTVIAHAALESGWGRHVPSANGRSSFNLFGVKAQPDWRGGAVNAATTEYVDGAPQRVSAGFRRYASAAAGVADYARLLSENSRYAGVLNTGADVTAFATALQRGGYATDPDYVRKLVATAAAVHDLRAQAALKSAAAPPIAGGEGTA
jgi:flagellar protein FlgJ